MDHWTIALVTFVITWALSVLLVARTIVLSHKLGLLDATGPRKVHARPVPRAGGIAVFAAFVAGLTFSYSLDIERFPAETERLLLLLGGATLIVAVMVYDDAIGISPLPKLAWQVAAAALVVAPRLRGDGHGIVIEQFNAPVLGVIEVPLVLALSLTMFWIVGMMNTLNWVDGLDGLAASVTVVASVVLFAHTYFWPRADPQFTVSILPLVLGAAVIGFLPFNWFPARIILGDAGANFLGFALAVASIIGGAKIATALLALGLPILDVAWVILYRIAHGRSPLQADRGHLHHRLLDNGWSQAQIVLFVAGTSMLFGLSSLLLPSRETKLVAILALGVLLLGILATIALRDQRRGDQRGQAMVPVQGNQEVNGIG